MYGQSIGTISRAEIPKARACVRFSSPTSYEDAFAGGFVLDKEDRRFKFECQI